MLLLLLSGSPVCRMLQAGSQAPLQREHQVMHAALVGEEAPGGPVALIK